MSSLKASIAALVCGALVLVIACTGCAMAEHEGERYAELRVNDAGKTQLVIVADQWGGLISGHGVGSGWVKNEHCWLTLDGPGPKYINPQLMINGSLKSTKYIGEITVDRVAKKVTISLQAVDSKTGQPDKVRPCSMNGTYVVKRTVHAEFEII